MHRLSSIILVFLLGTALLLGQSPHGENLQIDCAQCHNPEGWEIDFETLQFDHATTDFELEGAHELTDCASCHSDLVFENAPKDCISCHLDIHSQTVGNDCMRCHDTQSWLVDEIPELHEQNGFPLIGVHANVSCVECHTGDVRIIFNRIGNECIECHRQDYLATQNPNHVAAGYSTDCTECHNPFGFGWEAEGINHDFFPLTLGHDIQDCNQCHTSGTFSGLSPECVNCHLDDFNQTSNPNHTATGFSTDCIECHTTDPGWMPATFDHDDQFFPIYSGEHEGVWSDCVECHPNPSNYAVFTCTTCHTAGETNDEHEGISGYVYESTACLACHPTGNESEGFDHSATNFPLMGGHMGVDCIQCHADGYQGTPTDCESCHLTDFNQTTNPNHSAANFPTDCTQCHTVNAWEPADFDHDGMYFPIYSGEHQGEWNNCIDCHTDPNNYSIFDCLNCHPAGETNDDHEDVPDYQYTSNACFQCHPTGEEL
ncbi:cytochrome c3 family protein [Luteirhabdus pelagi]|uniref:cytochrome c3 family protein n=1 Tax=Luteirhabdus pelagi TaxID=2792783 RepID=UPI0019395047|nr:cytochrome c3 family protein [Luteirhabdus pelagi]